jgi:hypothetical protein
MGVHIGPLTLGFLMPNISKAIYFLASVRPGAQVQSQRHTADSTSG